MKYYVIAPDSSGGKGDEAMMRGVLNILHGADITVLTTPSSYYTWGTELLDRCGEFDERIVPFEDICAGISGKGTLIVVGADVLDGTCGVTPAISRICAIKKMLRLGGEVYALCSFRSDVDVQIVQKIKEAGDKVHWLLRENTSVENFGRLTGLKAEFFPDFAYYCEKTHSSTVALIKQVLQEKKKQGRTIVGLNFSQQSCNSFFTEKSDMTRSEYVRNVIRTVNDAIEQPYYVLISHDVRQYENHWSDSQFQELASAMLEDDSCLVLGDDITYPELLVLLSELDYIVSGRMHLAVASMRSGLVPIIYTGAGDAGKFSMAEKCKGMLDMRIGKPELVATDAYQLQEALKLVQESSVELKNRLEKQNLQNSDRENELTKSFRAQLNLDKIDEASVVRVDENAEIKSLRAMTRNALLLQEKTMQSLQQQMNDKSMQIECVTKQLNDKETELENMVAQLEVAKSELVNLNRDIQRKGEQLDNCANKINVLVELGDCYEGRMNRLNDLISQVEKRNFDLYMENQSLRDTMQQQGDEIHKLRRLLPIRLWCKLRGVR